MTNKKNSTKLRNVKWLSEVRKEMGISLYAMAKKLGMIEASYRYLENEAQGCKIATLVKVKKVSGKSWEEIGTMFEKDTDGK